MDIKSNLRWPGGKSKMIKNISPFFPKSINKYYELFSGGASIGINIMQKHKDIEEIYLNDIDPDLCNYYSVIKNNDIRTVFIEKLLKIKNNYNSTSFKIEFEKIKQSYYSDNISNAVKFFIVNKCGFSGLKMSSYSRQAFEKNFTIQSILKIDDIGKLLSKNNVIIENSDFKDSSIRDKSGFFIYIDPPYYSNSKKGLYGEDGKLHKNFDHELLYNIIKEISKNNNILISYDDTEFIRKLYSNFVQTEFNKKYSMTNTGGHICKIGKELLIKNYL